MVRKILVAAAALLGLVLCANVFARQIDLSYRPAPGDESEYKIVAKIYYDFFALLRFLGFEGMNSVADFSWAVEISASYQHVFGKGRNAIVFRHTAAMSYE